MLKNYLKIAYKVLLRRKFFTFVSLFGISFTLFVLIVVVAFVDYLAVPARPGSKFDRTLYVEHIELEGERYHVYSFPSYYLLDRYVRTMKTPEEVSIHSNTSTIHTYVGNRKLELDRKLTDAAFWDILEFEFIEGRPYSAEDVTNAAHVAVISDRARDQVFGRVPVVGKLLKTTEGDFRIVGVFRQDDIPAHSAYAQVFLPITTSRFEMTDDDLFSNCIAYVLAPKKSDFDEIKAEYAARLDDVVEDHKDKFDRVESAMGTQSDIIVDYFLGSESNGNRVAAIGLIIGAMILFMLFPAINLVNINVSRIIERSSEIGVRKAFGASSGALTLQFVVENVFLTLIGGLIAFAAALFSLSAISQSGLLPYWNFSINYRLLIYSLLVCLFFGLFSGALPAYMMSRLHPVQALRGSEL
jgi:putative ABC transport system permease protein